jgi:hypothetical protein
MRPLQNCPPGKEALMLRKARVFCLVTSCLGSFLQAILAQPPGFQGSPVPPPPPPFPAQGYNPVPPPGNQPSPAFVPALPADSVVAPSGGLFFGQQCGFYGMFEISLLFPEIRGFLSGPVTVTGLPSTEVTLGSASLDTIGSPRLEIGYRLGDGLGAVAVSYRSVVSKGGDNAPAFSEFGNPFLTSILNVNVVDIDYVSPAYNTAPLWNFSWRAGVRTAGVYYQNVVTGTFGNQEATSNFVGAGPHAEIEVGRALDRDCCIPGLAVVAKLDGAILVGNISQSFEETIQTSPPIGGASDFSRTQTVPTLTFDVGLSYIPPGNFSWARFGLGYQFEYWWDIGKSGSSHGDLMINGLYFRGEFNF